MRVSSRLLLAPIALLLSLPSVASALDFQSDFTDFSTNWLLEEGSEITQNPDSITLRATADSPKERGRILIRPILATVPEEIRNLTFVLEASNVTAPLAARVFYYDGDRNYLGSDPLFGTLDSGTIIATGTVLNPMATVAGIRVRLYSNSPQGSVTLGRLTISNGAIPQVPEPGTALLMGLGLAGLAAGGRRVGA